MIGYVLASGLGLLISYLIVRFFFYRPYKGVAEANVMAQLVVLSTNIQEIVDFLLAKQGYITEELKQKLIDRVAELKADEVINDYQQSSRVCVLPVPPPMTQDEKEYREEEDYVAPGYRRHSGFGGIRKA